MNYSLATCGKLNSGPKRYVKMEAEMVMMQLEAKECQQLPEDRREAWMEWLLPQNLQKEATLVAP